MTEERRKKMSALVPAGLSATVAPSAEQKASIQEYEVKIVLLDKLQPPSVCTLLSPSFPLSLSPLFGV